MLKGSTLYAVYDKVADDYIGPPLAAKHDAVATRMFADALNDDKSLLAQHPHDFELHALGYVDDSGQIIPATHTVITGQAYIDANSNDDGSGIPMTQRPLRKEA